MSANPAEFTLSQWLDQLSSPQPTPAAGALAFVTLAQCAALASKRAKLSWVPFAPREARAARFLAHARDDSETFGLKGSLALELARARDSLDFSEELKKLVFPAFHPALPDLTAIRSAAFCATRILLANLRANFEGKDSGCEELETGIAALEGRLRDLGG